MIKNSKCMILGGTGERILTMKYFWNEEEIEQEEVEICESDESRRSGIAQKAGRKSKPTRNNMNVATQKFLDKKFGNKCSIQTCIKPAEEIHHTQRWSLSQNHDPHYLAPLCKYHHEIAHSIDQKFIQYRQELKT